MSSNKKTIIKIIGLAIVFITMAIVALNKSYYALIISLFGIYSIVATSLDILFGYTGQISLGHAGLFAIGAYSSAILTMKYNIPSLISLFLGVIVTMIIGSIIAIPASKLVKHFLSLLMIAFGQIIYLLINNMTNLTGGSLGIMNIPFLNFLGIKIDTNFKSAILIWIFVIIILIAKNNIINSRIGRAFMAIKNDSIAAESCGISSRKYKILAFTMSSALAGFAGGLYAFLRGFISPETFNGTQSLLFMTMLLFGGMNSTWGPVIGACILLLFKEVLQVFSNWQGLIYALLMLLSLFLFPKGIIGVIESIIKKKEK